MRSESLIRLHVEHPQHIGNQVERKRIESETEKFLARGGRVQQIPSTLGTSPIFGFNMGNHELASIARCPGLAPDREEVDGVVLIRRRLVAKKVGIALNTITKWAREGRFPKPVREGKSSRWVESEVDAWLAGPGKDYKPRPPRA